MNPQNEIPLKTSSQFSKTISSSKKDKISPFLALKILKQTQTHVQTVRKRYQVIEAQDIKLKNRSLLVQRQIKMFESVRQSKSKQKSVWEKVKEQRKKEVQKYKEKNYQKKNQHASRVKQLQQSISKQHKFDRDYIRQVEKQGEKKIGEMKKMEFTQKRVKRNIIVQSQEKTRKQVYNFRTTKQSTFKNQKTIDTTQIMKKIQAKQKQLRKISQKEQQLVKKRENSMNLSQSMRQRLKRVTVTDKSFRSSRLPNIKSRSVLNNEAILSEGNQQE